MVSSISMTKRCPRQVLDTLHLLQQLGGRSALAGPGLLADEDLDRGGGGDLRQLRYGHAGPVELVVTQGLLGMPSWSGVLKPAMKPLDISYICPMEFEQ